jgi:hypothetical protein
MARKPPPKPKPRPRKLVQRLPRARKAARPVAQVPETPATLSLPSSKEALDVELKNCIAEVQTMVAGHAAAGRHPLPLFEAMMAVMGTHIDAIAKPTTGDDLTDRLCVALRDQVRARRAQLASLEQAATP